ncbi:MAG: isoaspartyl peptidase/L-asparaginase [Maricaulaceae bacterium]
MNDHVDWKISTAPRALVRLVIPLAAALLAGCASMEAGMSAGPAPRWSIALHGGAGVIDRAEFDAETEARYRAALSRALAAGADVLEGGGTSLDAVEAAIRDMEDDPLFNSGRGAVFTAEGRNELDASIMDGRTRNAGAVAGVTRTRHPITAARKVMEVSPHVLLIGEGAEVFARAEGVEEVAPSYFFTERRWRQMENFVRDNGLPVPERPEGAPAPDDTDVSAVEEDIDEHRFGTVGVIALDSHGDLAAGTSTGGLTGKRWGRVGDSPIVGAGTYAQNGVCAVSATGSGEYFIRIGVARNICARMELTGLSAEDASAAVIDGELTDMGGSGGVIVMDGRGEVAFRFNTSGMYRARQTAGEAPVVQIFDDED